MKTIKIGSKSLASQEDLQRSSPLVIIVMLVALQLFTSHPSCNESYLPESTSITNGDDNNNKNNNNTAFLEEPQIANSNYSWIGDHWIPPQGVPRYSPQQMKDIFSKSHGMLWTGDSTGRQNMHTMFNMMDAPDFSDITILALNNSVNENKKKKDRKCVDRDFSNTTVLGHNLDPYTFHCRNIPGADTNSSSNTSQISPSSPSQISVPHRGKFDYMKSPCPDVMTQVANDELNGTLASLLNGYDWLVIDFGIWEIEQNWDCRRHNRKEPTRIRIGNTLDLMERLASPRLKILWKTMGTAHNIKESHSKNLHAVNNQVRQWFASRNPKHMHLVDWAQQMDPRSDDENRIGGDTFAHWGWSARLLVANMITHAVVTL